MNHIYESKRRQINLFQANIPLLYPIQTSKKRVFLKFPGGVEMETFACNGWTTMSLINILYFSHEEIVFHAIAKYTILLTITYFQN